MITCLEMNSAFLVSQTNMPMFKTVVDFMVAHFERNVDKACKKYIATAFKDMFVDYSGLF